MALHWRSKETFIRLLEFQHVKPGKGAAFVRTKLKEYHQRRCS